MTRVMPSDWRSQEIIFCVDMRGVQHIILRLDKHTLYGVDLNTFLMKDDVV